jgi:hypothetical protein
MTILPVRADEQQPEPADGMKKKHVALICLGILAVCLPTAYAALMVGMAESFGYADWSLIYRDVVWCSVIVGLGICAIYQGLKHRKTPRRSRQTQV